MTHASATLAAVARPPTQDAVVVIQRGPVGAHVGVWYRLDDAGARRCLHLAWHYDLRDDTDLADFGHWVVPALDELALHDVRTSARLIADRGEYDRVPYAFDRADARFDGSGAFQQNASLGLTCATFVQLVFEHAGIQLLDDASWDQRSAARRAEDEAAHAKLVDWLAKSNDAGSRRHAELVRADIGCARVRAEEVAGASGLSELPVPFERAQRDGAALLARLPP